MDFVLGLLIVLMGVAILRYRYEIYHFTGEWDWANKYLGSTGTIVAISLIGMLLIAVGTAYPFGVIDIQPNADSMPQFKLQ